MNRSEPSIIVAAFEDHLSAARAINELHRANFRNDQFGLAEVGGNPTDLFTELTRRGVPEVDARYYAQQYNEGHPIVTLSIDKNEPDLLQQGMGILSRNGSYKAPDQHAETTARSDGSGSDIADLPTSIIGQNRTDPSFQANQSQDRLAPQQPDLAQHLALREEVLQPDKQMVQAGEVIVSKRLVTEEKTIRVPVTHEEITIERRPSTRGPEAVKQGEATGVDNSKIVELAEGESIKILLYEEQVNVTKTPVVKEEVILGKQLVQETREIKETVKREVPDIERQGNVHVQMPEENPKMR